MWNLTIKPRSKRRRRRQTVTIMANAQLAISGRSTEGTPIILSGSSSPSIVNTLNGNTQVRIFATLMRGTNAIPDAEVYAYVGAANAVRMFDDGVGKCTEQNTHIETCGRDMYSKYIVWYRT